MRAAALAVALAAVSTLIAFGAFAGSAAATCAVGAQYDEYGQPCPVPDPVPDPGSGGGQYTPPGSGGGQYTPPGSGGSQYNQYGGSGGGPVVTPQGWATENRMSSLDFASSVDAVDDAAVEFGVRQWRGEIANYDSTVIPNGEIAFNHIDPSWAFVPPVTAPVHAGPQDIAPFGGWLGASDLSGPHEVRGVSMNVGYDAWRTFDTTQIPGGGGTQTTTLHVILRDARFASGWVSLQVVPNWYGGSAAAIETANVTTSTLTNGEFAAPVFVTPTNAFWQIQNAQLNVEYAVTVPIDVTNSSSGPIAFKPMELVHAGHATPLAPVTASATEIADTELGGPNGAWSFQSTMPVNWNRSVSEIFETNFEPIPVPSWTLAVDHPDVNVHAGGWFDETATVTPLNGFTGDVGFFTSGPPDSHGGGTAPPAGIWVSSAWPQPVSVGPGAGTRDIEFHVDAGLAPGDYALYLGTWGTSAPQQLTPITIHVGTAFPQANADEARMSTAVLPGGMDSVGSTDALTGSRGWTAGIWNWGGSTPIPDATVQLDGTSLVFTPPPGTFPLTATDPSLVANERVELDDIAGWSPHSRVQGVGFSSGYDLTRSVSPATLPATGGRQTVTLSFTARDSSLSGQSFDLRAQPRDPDHFSSFAASFDPASVVLPVLGSGEWLNSNVTSDWIDVGIANIVLNKTYTLTFEEDVPGTDGATDFAYKPFVEGATWAGTQGSHGTGLSFAKADAELGGTFTYSSTSGVHWSFWRNESATVGLGAVIPALPAQAHAGDYRSKTFDIGPGVDTVDAATARPATLAWQPYIFSYQDATIGSPTITFDGSTLPWSPAVTFPLAATGPDLHAKYEVFWYGDSPIGGGLGSSTATVSEPVGAAIQRSGSPVVIPPGGGVQDVSLAITPQASYPYAWLDVSVNDLVPGATIVPGSVHASPGPDTAVYLSPDGSSASWTGAATAATTYTLTFQVDVPNSGPGGLVYKPAVYAGAESSTDLGAGPTGTSATIADALLGGNVTFSADNDVIWSQLVQLEDRNVNLAPLADPVAAVDHFTVKPIAASIGDGKPLKVTITAFDAANKVVKSFAGPLDIDDVPGTLAVDSISWVNGVATAFVRLQGPQAGDKITVAYGTAQGLSALINVLGPVTKFSIAPATPYPVAGAPLQVTVKALDALNRVVPDYDGTSSRSYWEIRSGGPDALTPTAESWSKGVGTLTLVLPTIAKAARIQVDDVTLGLSSQSNAINVLGPLDHFAVSVAPNALPADSTTQATVTFTAKDVLNDTIPSYAGPVSLVDDTGGLVWGGTATWLNGVGKALVAFGVAGPDHVTVSDGPASGTSGLVAVYGAVAKFLVSVAPSSVPAGDPATVTVTAKDTLNQTVVDYSGSPDLTDSAGVTPAGAWTWLKGVGKAPVSFATPLKGDKVTATDSTLTPTATGQSGAFNVTGPVTRFRVAVAPASVPVAADLNLFVYAEDANGSTVVGFDGSAHSIQLSDSDPSAPVISGGALTWLNGVGKGVVQLDRAVKGDKLTVTDSTAALTGTSSAFNVTGPVARFRVTVAPGSVPVGGNLTLFVYAEDAKGSTVVGFDGTGHVITIEDSDASNPVISGGPLVWKAGAGYATATLQFGSPVKADKLTVSDATASLTGTSNAFNVLGPVTKFKVTAAPANLLANTQQLTITTTAQDDAGNTITSYAQSLSYVNTTASLTVASEAAWLNGSRITKATIATKKVGDTVTVSSSTGPPVSGTSNAFTVK